MATPSVGPSPAAAFAASIIDIKDDYGLLFASEIGAIVENLPAQACIVEGLLTHASINILVGDSGVGKTALGYQLALAVASGTPFLGMAVEKSRVLMVDYENGIWDFNWILEQQRRHLGLEKFPSNFLLSPGYPDSSVEEVMERLRPQLVILDSLRSFDPRMEQTMQAAKHIRALRHLVRQYGAAVLLMHHVQKRGRKDLESLSPLDWLERSAGTRALINQTDTRLALAARKDDTLVLSGQARTRGPIGPIFLERAWDDDGEPLGYVRAPASLALDNPEQHEAYQKLPASFRFKDARLAYGRQDPATLAFLNKLIHLGLLVKVARGEYAKCENGQNGVVSPEMVSFEATKTTGDRVV